MKIFRLFLDFMLAFSPIILVTTIFHHYITTFILSMIVLITINFVIYLKIWNREKNIDWNNIGKHPICFKNPKRLSYISNMMSSLLLVTCVTIFAVDFSVFDRRFVKTETYGWSLMDVGIGAFIAINAGLSPESRLKNISRKERFVKNLKSNVPLLILGLIRLISIKLLNYQEHVTEYGIHWNFFFTISFVKVLFLFLFFFSNFLKFLIDHIIDHMLLT